VFGVACSQYVNDEMRIFNVQAVEMFFSKCSYWDSFWLILFP